MLVVWVVSVAQADPPDRIVRLWEINSAGEQVERMALSPSGDVLAGRTRGDLSGWMLDIDGWTMHTFGPCDVTGVAPLEIAPVAPATDGVEEIWMSCGDGSVRGKSWNGTSLTDVLDTEGAPLVFEGIDESLSGIWYDADSALLYALHAPEDDTPVVVHVIDPFVGTWDAETGLVSYPRTLPHNGFNEATISDGTLVVSHGGSDMTALILGSDSAVGIPDTFAGAFGCEDLAPRPLGGVYCVASAASGGFGAASEYTLATNQFYALQLGSLINPQAICANPDLSDGWLAVTGDQVTVWQMSESGAILDLEDPYFRNAPDAENPIQDMVTDAGYLYGGGIAGNLHIITARPWVYPGVFTVSPADATDGDTVTVSFQVNDDSDWVLRRGGDRTGEGGVILRSGSTDADTTVTTEIEVDDGFAEGDNRLFVIATNEADLDGHGSVVLSVDNPPEPPVLGSTSVQFADEALILAFDGIDDEDLDHYEVWVTTTPFDGADWANEGGPAYDGSTNLKTPISVPSAPGARVTHRIAPLENGVTYYIGVRAWDVGGKGGPMSRVVSGKPLKTYSAAELAGEEGGAPCSTGPASGSWLAWLGVAALATRRRAVRRTSRGTATTAIALAVGLGLAGDARAQDDDPWWRQDTTKSSANFEMRYGSMGLEDPAIEQIYGNGSNLLMMEMGPQFFRLAEVDLSIGFLQELAKSQTDDGQVSGERTMLTLFPLGIDITARAHILDEQPVVPFVRYGWDYILFSDKSDDGFGGKTVIRGAKFGTHAGLGANFLLDLVSPNRASLLEAQTGINDSWLTVEWRRQSADSRSSPLGSSDDKGFNLSGDAVLIGLKLDW